MSVLPGVGSTANIGQTLMRYFGRVMPNYGLGGLTSFGPFPGAADAAAVSAAAPVATPRPTAGTRMAPAGPGLAIPQPVLMGGAPNPEAGGKTEWNQPQQPPLQTQPTGTWDRLKSALTSPNLSTFAQGASAALLAPRQQGQSEFQQLAGSLLQGYGALQQRQMMQYALQRQQMQDAIAQQEAQAKTTTAEAARTTAAARTTEAGATAEERKATAAKTTAETAEIPKNAEVERRLKSAQSGKAYAEGERALADIERDGEKLDQDWARIGNQRREIELKGQQGTADAGNEAKRIKVLQRQADIAARRVEIAGERLAYEKGDLTTKDAYLQAAKMAASAAQQRLTNPLEKAPASEILAAATASIPNIAEGMLQGARNSKLFAPVGGPPAAAGQPPSVPGLTPAGQAWLDKNKQ